MLSLFLNIFREFVLINFSILFTFPIFIKSKLVPLCSDGDCNKFFCGWFLGAEFAFSIFDMDGEDCIDANSIGDVLRALNCNPTLATIEKMGGTKKRGEKKLKIEEFLPIYAQVC